MIIDKELCIGCGRCIPYCPVGVITLQDKKANIDIDECLECGNCLRSGNCPTDAIVQQELQWPRSIRSLFSDPLTITDEAGIAGRGTEEMKTNDVTGRIKRGELGVGIELGRPVLGARLYDVEKVTKAVSKLNVKFEPANPLTSLLMDTSKGILNKEVLNEKVLSAIVEFNLSIEYLEDLINVLKEVEKEIDTVFTLGIASRVNDDGTLITTEILDHINIWHAPNGKCNVGLGRPLFKEDEQ